MNRSAENKSYYIEAYGCQMNLYDADLLGGILEKSGYFWTSDLHSADVILVNTCSVRANAEKRAIGRIRTLSGLKREKPSLRLVVCGCMAQRLGDELLRMIPGVDLVVGTGGYRDLPGLLDRSNASRIVETSGCESEVYSQLTPRYQGGVTAFVAVMRGCDNRCAYCVVPRLRGPARSRGLTEILREVRDLVAEGCSQVTFLGQNVNAYRDGSNDFSELLNKADRIDGLKRIRFVTSHPKDMDERILMAMAESNKVCEHLHLPLQSGSNSILRAMHRGYTAEQYEDLVSRARQLLPGLSITTDIIAGFPGEAEKDFEDTLDLMRRIEFDHAFTFQYSRRKGTEAARLPDQVPPEIRQNRLERLIALRREITHDLLMRLVGQRVEVLVEGRSKRNTGELIGRTRTHKPVVFPGRVDLIGQLRLVDVKRAGGGTAWGEISPVEGQEDKDSGSQPGASSPAP